MSKKLVNEPENVVDDSLAGFLSIHTGLQLLEGRRVVVRTDLDEERAKGHVLLLTGGGSGHEPALAGMVGPGMLTAAVPGAIFTSPPPADIQAALETIGHNHPAGVLVIVLNYTGDRLNFGRAVENARNLGIRIATVTVGEDCALSSQDRTAGRRGLTGSLFIFKMAGALADEGRSLEEIHSILTEAVNKMGSIGLSLSACTVPGRAPTFTLGHDEMELGLGVHGEAGVRRMKILPAKQAVAAMLDHMTNPKSSTHLPIKKGDHVAMLLNNLGGTSQLEMGILIKEIITYIESLGAHVVRAYSGSYITSLEMAGIIVSVMHVNSDVKRWLDAPTSAPCWTRPLMSRDRTDRVMSSRRPVVRRFADDVTQKGVKCDQATSRLIFGTLTAICRVLMESEVRLNTLDTEAGDGDCGTTMRRGAADMVTALGEESYPGLSIGQPSHLMSELSAIASQSMGGTSGALYSLFLSSSASALVEACDCKAWLQAFKSGMDAVMEYGGAKVGDRTMLDAMFPAYEAARKHMDGDLKSALSEAVKASGEGASRTAGMAAHAGRASYVHADNLCQPDAGAVACALWIEAACNFLTTKV